MSKILHLHKKLVSSHNRIFIKDVYKKKESTRGHFDMIQVLVETPSGDYKIQDVSDESPFLYLIKDGRMKKFSISDLIYIYNDQICFFQNYRIFYIKPPSRNYFDLSRLRSLIVTNQYISELYLESLEVEYLDLRDNYLTRVYCDKRLRYCDLRGNYNIRHNIVSDILLVSNKKVQKNFSRHKKLTEYSFYESIKYTQRNAIQRNAIQRNDIQRNDIQRNDIQRNDIQRNAIQRNAIQRNDIQRNDIQRNDIENFKFNSSATFTKYKVYNISCRFYIVQEGILDFKYILKVILKNISTSNLLDTIEYIYNKIKKMCLTGRFYIICVTEEEIIIKTHRVRIVFDYFLRREILYKEHTYIFDNIWRWYILPLLDYSQESLDYSLDYLLDYSQESLDYLLDYSLDYSVIITNQGNAHKTDSVLVRKCTVPDPKSVIRKYKKKNKVTKDKKLVFMFIKFYETKTGTKSNLKKQKFLLERLKTIKTCKVIEDNGTDGIIFMSQDLKNVLSYSLYIKKVFGEYKIDLSIGIACGQYFFKMGDKRCKFMGNVLNTASRMSYLGKGVYCCECAVVDSDKVYFQYVGEREVRGYGKCIKTYLVYKR